MPELWIPVTIAAAFCQNLRSAIQKHLSVTLSAQGAAYARFLFALPWALLYLLFLMRWSGHSLPAPGLTFVGYVLLGSVSQIAAAVLLLQAFRLRSFAVGTSLSKLEVVLVALLGTWILGDQLRPLGWLAVCLSGAGLVLLSAGQSRLSISSLKHGLRERATLLGLGSAVGLGLSVIGFRGASLSLAIDDAWLSASVTLGAALTLQSVLMGAYLALIEPGEYGRMLKSWRWGIPVGIAGMLASVCWFTAFTLQNASYVRALGQIELLFTFFFTIRIFRERIRALELLGSALIVGGILLLLLHRA